MVLNLKHMNIPQEGDPNVLLHTNKIFWSTSARIWDTAGAVWDPLSPLTHYSTFIKFPLFTHTLPWDVCGAGSTNHFTHTQISLHFLVGFLSLNIYFFSRGLFNGCSIKRVAVNWNISLRGIWYYIHDPWTDGKARASDRQMARTTKI